VDELAKRRALTLQLIASLRDRLSDAEKLADGKACVYATGSFGRGEANRNSDLDLFIVGLSSPDSKSSMLNRLDEICIKADLIEALRNPLIFRDSKKPEFESLRASSRRISRLGDPCGRRRRDLILFMSS